MACINVSIKLRSTHLKASCRMICGYHYLDVWPQEAMWITNYESILYTVKSDTTWNVECKESWIEVDPTHGSYNDTISVRALEINEGIDRDAFITFNGGGSSVIRTVKQEGLREIFEDDFILVDGGTFNVLKNK